MGLLDTPITLDRLYRLDISCEQASKRLEMAQDWKWEWFWSALSVFWLDQSQSKWFQRWILVQWQIKVTSCSHNKTSQKGIANSRILCKKDWWWISNGLWPGFLKFRTQLVLGISSYKFCVLVDSWLTSPEQLLRVWGTIWSQDFRRTDFLHCYGLYESCLFFGIII